MNDYWSKRVLANEEKAQKYAGKTAKRQQKLYKDAYKEIVQELERLALQIREDGKYGTLSRTELWQYKKFIDLQETIGRLFEGMSGTQISMTTEMLRQVFEETMGFTLEDLGKPPEAANVGYSLLNETQVNQVLNTAWSGKHYSQRIYGTNSKIAERVKKDITDMVIQGKNTEQIKKRLMLDFDVSYSYADRLIRTEASHIYNEAAKKAYEEAKVTEVEIVGTKDEELCPTCGKNLGKKFKMGTQPRLPIHPNCRCCYAPVVNLAAKKF